MGEIVLKDIYKKIKKIAVIGSSPKENRPVYKVSVELIKRNYEIYPINPNYEVILEKKVYKDIRDIEDDVDMAVFFINSNAVLKEIEKALEKNVKYIWLQEGIVSEEGRKMVEMNNAFFMEDKCIYKELLKIENSL